MIRISWNSYGGRASSYNYGRSASGGGFGFAAIFHSRENGHGNDHYRYDNHQSYQGYNNYGSHPHLGIAIHLGRGQSGYSSRSNQGPRYSQEEIIEKHKDQAIANKDKNPQAYNDYMNFAVREAVAAARCWNSDPKIVAEGTRQWRLEGEKIINNERGGLTFVGSMEAAKALSDTYFAAREDSVERGDNGKLAALEQKWREASKVPYGPRRDAKIIESMASLNNRWNQVENGTSKAGDEIPALRAIPVHANQNYGIDGKRILDAIPAAEMVIARAVAVDPAKNRDINGNLIPVKQSSVATGEWHLYENKLNDNFTYKVAYQDKGDTLSIAPFGDLNKTILVSATKENRAAIDSIVDAAKNVSTVDKDKAGGAYRAMLTSIADACKNNKLTIGDEDKAKLNATLMGNEMPPLASNSRASSTSQDLKAPLPQLALEKAVASLRSVS